MLPSSQAAPLLSLNGHGTKRSTTLGNQPLLNIVQEAVDSTVNLLGENATITNDNTFHLVNHIVAGLLSAGINFSPKCMPKPEEDLKREFLEANINNSSSALNNNICLTLEKMTVGRATGMEENIYYIKTNSSCTNDVVIDSACYGSGKGQQNQCSLSTHLQLIAANRNKRRNYFPQYTLQLMCGGCSFTDTECIRTHNSCYVDEKIDSFIPLKKVEGSCDNNGYELWTKDPEQTQNVVVACSCIKVYE